MFKVDIDSIHTASEKTMCSPIKIMFSLIRFMFAYTDLKWFWRVESGSQTTRGEILNRGIFWIFFFQHCFICRPSDSTVSKDAGIEPTDCCDFAALKGKEERNLPSRPCHRQHHRSSCSAAHPGWLTGPSGAQAPDRIECAHFQLA